MLSRLYASLLFDVKPGDLATLAVAVGILVTVSLLATYVPAAKASKADPLLALRSEKKSGACAPLR